ncbi:PfkB family carbohydrate kinase [Bosea sp. 685]|uniref:PfkB family carbohydrate kinase n=1 Tax=Bosea sp. 685 TaxID=3080057 RepID=UPI0028938113|nr:PfkB family carbohydrate kinase [Bosea sp. 685]WNJ90918.1 PfkB family carbohydrate kinase [Bosea sp. 685]
MIIAGGVYREECIRPQWSRIFGSGGRAAAAVSLLSPGSKLVGYACSRWAEDARHSMAAFDVTADLKEIDDDIAFHYLHPLGQPELIGMPDMRRPSLVAIGEVVLRFGFIEGDAVVSAKRAIYDPQNAREVLHFADNGSTADELAIVLNQSELAASVGKGGQDGARELMARCKADVVIVKNGPDGALIVDRSDAGWVPAYSSGTIFKIGSGDVFSAAFAHFWGEERFDPAEAADLASRAVANYVETRNVQIERAGLEGRSAQPSSASGKRIYLAGPFFTLGQRWLIEEARRCIEMLGCDTFSPVHDVGVYGSAVDIAEADLAGLEKCGAVFAIVDGEDAGTLFEIGYARKLGIPVVALAENTRPESQTMLDGSGCEVVADFTTAIYRAIWAAHR